MSDASGASARPVLRIVSGDPSPEELAALTALMASAGGEDEPAPPVRRGGWSDPARSQRRPLLPGPNGWLAPRW